MSQPVPLNPEQHGALRLRDGVDVARFGSQQVLPVTVHEFAKAGSDCPLVFVKNSESGQFQSVQLVGLAPNENLMLDGEDWKGNYIPGALRLDPLRLVITAPGSDQLAVAVDPDSPLLGQDEGERLFNDDGEPSEYLAGLNDALGQYYEHGQVTQAFISRLKQLNLLRSQELSIKLKGEKFIVNGLYLVDEARLRELSDEDTLDLVRKGYLQAIHSHLMSLNKVRSLARIVIARTAQT